MRCQLLVARPTEANVFPRKDGSGSGQMLFPDRYFQGLDALEAANKDQVKKERNSCLSNIILSNDRTYKL